MAEKVKNGQQWSYVTINFVKKDRLGIEKIDNAAERVESVLTGFAIAGYKVGFSFDSRSDCYIAAITGKESTGQDSRKTFTIYHSQFSRLLMGLCYVFDQAQESNSLAYLYDVKYESDW